MLQVKIQFSIQTQFFFFFFSTSKDIFWRYKMPFLKSNQMACENSVHVAGQHCIGVNFFFFSRPGLILNFICLLALIIREENRESTQLEKNSNCDP